MSDTAITTIVTGVVTVVVTVVTFLTLWVKLKYGVEKTEEVAKQTIAVDSKIQENTILTKAATEAAASTAAVAVKSANESREATAEISATISKKLNGGIDAAVAQAMEPVQAILKDHDAKIEELNQYIHDRNHDILSALQSQSNKLEIILKRIGQGRT